MTGVFAVDCDDLIESLTKMKIKDIGRHAERIPHYRRVADSEPDVAGLSADAIAGQIRASLRKKTWEEESIFRSLAHGAGEIEHPLIGIAALRARSAETKTSFLPVFNTSARFCREFIPIQGQRAQL